MTKEENDILIEAKELREFFQKWIFDGTFIL